MSKINGSSVIIILMLLIIGCGGKKESHVPVKTQVTIWAHEGQPAEKKALQSIFDAFNKAHKNIHVKAEYKQEQGYGDRVNAAAIAGALPDILDVDGPYTAHFADMGILFPLDELISKEILKDFLPTIISQGTFKGRLYTLGTFESTIVIFYNRKILGSCGIKTPDSIDNAWTWEEFLNALQVIKNKRPNIMPVETFMPWGGEWLTYAFSPLIWSNKANLLSGEGGKAQGYLNSVESVKAIRQWQILFNEKLSNRNAVPGQFRRGRAAMAWGIFNRWPLYTESKIDFGMMPLPKFKRHCSPSGSWCWGLTAKCADKKAALKALEWLIHPEHGIVPMCRANGGIPSRESAIKLMTEYQETRGLFIEQLRHTARARPVTPIYATLTTEFSRALEDISKGVSVKSALDKAAANVDNVLAAK
ncbi:MAG: sugar ABC transporter substrate-binding protein [bacterium]